MKLERILQAQGFGSRRQCRQLVELGEVRIQGEVVDNPGAEIATAGLVFEVEGESWVYREKTYLALHKPAGYECSHEPKHHRGVYSLLPHQLVERNVQSVPTATEELAKERDRIVEIWMHQPFPNW